MSVDLTFINESTYSAPLMVFINPVSGDGNRQGPQAHIPPQGTVIVPYPIDLGSKILVSVQVKGVLLFGGEFDLTGMKSCDVAVSVTPQGYPEVSLANAVME